jgi:hypothetical protein
MSDSIQPKTYADLRREIDALHGAIMERGERNEHLGHLATVFAHDEFFTFVASSDGEVRVRFFTAFGGFMQMIDCKISIWNSPGWIKLFNDATPQQAQL